MYIANRLSDSRVHPSAHPEPDLDNGHCRGVSRPDVVVIRQSFERRRNQAFDTLSF
jgi:hypothetical protein